MFKLHPSEELELEVKSNPTVKARTRSRYLIVLGFVLLVVAFFYRFASAQDTILMAIAWGSGVGAVLSFIGYFYSVSKARKESDVSTYYITNTRVIEIDKDGEMVRDILRNKIKRVEVDKVSGSMGDVIINPKELSKEKKYKKELKGETGAMYSKDTFIINSIRNAQEFADKLN